MLKIVAIAVLSLGTGLLLVVAYDQVRLASIAEAQGAGVDLTGPLTYCFFVAAILAGGGLALFKRRHRVSILLSAVGTFFAFWAWAVVAAGVGM